MSEWTENRPTRGWRALDVGEVWRYRHLIATFARRDVTVGQVTAIAAAAGGSLRDVVKVSVFLSSIDLFPGFDATYARIVHELPRPARTTTGAELRGIMVEIDAVLYLPR